jgi:hypothetical protein
MLNISYSKIVECADLDNEGGQVMAIVVHNSVDGTPFQHRMPASRGGEFVFGRRRSRERGESRRPAAR